MKCNTLSGNSLCLAFIEAGEKVINLSVQLGPVPVRYRNWLSADPLKIYVHVNVQKGESKQAHAQKSIDVF